jgi:hypothetical protein
MRQEACRNAAGAGAGQLLRDDDPHEEIGRRSAVFFREAEAEQADGGGFLVKLAREPLRLVPLRRVRLDLLLHEPADGRAEGFMLFGVKRTGQGRPPDAICRAV